MRGERDMTRAEVIASLEDQARDKDSLAGEEPDGIFARDAEALRQAAGMLRERERPCAYCGIFERHRGYLAEHLEHAMRYCWNCGRKLVEDGGNEGNEDTGLTPEEIMALVQPPNDQLTLEELREMGLFEWLWVEVIHPTKSQLLCKVESAYYQVFEDYTDGDAICCGWPGLIHDFAYEDYGKTWIAYRRKPEEGMA